MTNILNITYLDVCQKLTEASQHYSSLGYGGTKQGTRHRNLRHLCVILKRDINEHRPNLVAGTKGRAAVQIGKTLEHIATELGVPSGTVTSYLNTLSTCTYVSYRVPRNG